MPNLAKVYSLEIIKLIISSDKSDKKFNLTNFSQIYHIACSYHC